MGSIIPRQLNASSPATRRTPPGDRTVWRPLADQDNGGGVSKRLRRLIQLARGVEDRHLGRDQNPTVTSRNQAATLVAEIDRIPTDPQIVEGMRRVMLARSDNRLV
ncbi:MAG: hypothetical protein R3C56_19675 [Pirellulaceae bacterium]